MIKDSVLTDYGYILTTISSSLELDTLLNQNKAAIESENVCKESKTAPFESTDGLKESKGSI
jgi:hypothetical protein